MKKIKRFEIDVWTAFNRDDYNEPYPLKIVDLEESHANAQEGYPIAEIQIEGEYDAFARFTLNLDAIEALTGVLEHIRTKVMEMQKNHPKSAQPGEKQ
jgi:hypothetical protein